MRQGIKISRFLKNRGGFALAVAASVWLAFSGTPSLAQHIRVATTPTEVRGMLSERLDGDTIRLKLTQPDQNDIGALELNGAQTVTLTLAQERTKPYVIKTNIVLKNTRLILRNLKLEPSDSSQPIIWVGENATLEAYDCCLEGDFSGTGVQALGGTRIDGCEFIGLHDAVVFENCLEACSIEWSYFDRCFRPITITNTKVAVRNNLIVDTGDPLVEAGVPPVFVGGRFLKPGVEEEEGDPIFSDAITVRNAGDRDVLVAHNTVYRCGGGGLVWNNGKTGKVRILSNVFAIGDYHGIHAEATEEALKALKEKTLIENDFNSLYGFNSGAYGLGVDPGPNSVNNLPGTDVQFGIWPEFVGDPPERPDKKGANVQRYEDGQFQLKAASTCIGTGAGYDEATKSFYADGSDIGRFGPMPPQPTDSEFKGTNVAPGDVPEMDFFPKNWANPVNISFSWKAPSDYAQGTLSGYRYRLIRDWDNHRYNPTELANPAIGPMGMGDKNLHPDGVYVFEVRGVRTVSYGGKSYAFEGRPLYFIFRKYNKPTITAPPDVTVEADTFGGWNKDDHVLGTAGHTPYPEALTMTNDGPVFFALGPTVVTWTAAWGLNTVQDTQTVTVVDTTPPIITLLGDNPLTLECTTPYAEPGYSATDVCAGDLTGTIVRTGSVNQDIPGDYTLYYDVTDPSGNSAQQQTRTVKVVDTTPPAITLKGANPLTLQCGTPYAEPGYTATDICAGDLTGAVVVTGSVNHGAVGSYTLHYNVTDPSGNPAEEKTRTVNVVDTKSPAITLSGPNPFTLECGTSYVDPGYTATDICAGDLTNAVVITGSVNHNAAGTYNLRYNVSDPSGNPAVQKVRTVHVVDTTPPEITLSGANPLTLECGTSYVDPGYNASDICAGDLTAKVVVSGSVNHKVPGEYVLHYNVKDYSGNHAEENTRTVKVVDTTAPIITLSGGNPLTLECATPYVEPGFTATDVCAGDLTGSVAVTGSVNHNVRGEYTLRYNVSDPSGNPAEEKTRTVNVVDTTPPVIALSGDNPLTLEVGTPYAEPGYTATDVCAGDLTGAVVVAGSVDHNVPGKYPLYYNVTDPSGNDADEKTRTVFVAENPTVLGMQKNSDGSITVRWSDMGPDFVYTLEFCESLTGGTWAPIIGVWPKSVTAWTDTRAHESPTMRFYRVRAEGK